MPGVIKHDGQTDDMYVYIHTCMHTYIHRQDMSVPGVVKEDGQTEGGCALVSVYACMHVYSYDGCWKLLFFAILFLIKNTYMA
jgi:hypothetical protein